MTQADLGHTGTLRASAAAGGVLTTITTVMLAAWHASLRPRAHRHTDKAGLVKATMAEVAAGWPSRA